MKLCLGEIVEFLKAKVISDPRHHPDLKEQISGVSIDSRSIKPGEIFFAIKGERFDGHDFLGEAFKKGALAAVVDHNRFEQWELGKNNFLLAVIDPLKALQELASYCRSRFSLPLIAITGSNGKTTTKDMIANVLSTKYLVLKNPGNLNNHLGVSLTLFQLTEKHEIAITEMGANHFGEVQRLCAIAKPTHGLITNVGKGHLQFFRSMEGVAMAKAELFQYLNGQGTAFINIDDPLIAKYAYLVKNTISYGFHPKVDVRGEYLGTDHWGRSKLRVNGEVEVRLKVLGKHNIHNALGAACVGIGFGVELDKIKVALENFTGGSKRMEVIEHHGLRILDDTYNSNPDSAKAALEILVGLDAKAGKRRIAVLGDMLELGEASGKEHRVLGVLAAQSKLDGLLTFGEASRAAAEEASKLGLKNVHHFVDKKKLVKFLKDTVKEGDVILVKGSRAMAMEEVVEGLISLTEEQ